MSATTTDRTHAALDIAWVRAQFPSLRLTVAGRPAAFLDAPAGTQVPQQVVDAISNYLLHDNANTAGAFLTSRRTDAMLASAHRAMADYLGCDADEVHFGQNMTTLTFAFARAIGRELKPGDEILTTTLDHDANVAPWRALEAERGVVVRQADVRIPECTLDMDDLRRKITPRTRVVAAGYAANAVGTLNDVAMIVRLAREAGALSFIDAVHYAPHGPIDVKALGCDFLACSPYKFFGPHMGALYGKREHVLRLHPYKVRPAPDNLPDRWETGTLSHEGIAGVAAAIDYIASIGRRSVAGIPEGDAGRRAAILAAYDVIREYEGALMRKLIAGLVAIPGLTFYGISDPAQFAHRVPTVGIRLAHKKPAEIAAYLGERGIFTWDGNYYAVNLTERLGVESDGGLLRIGLVHYNTAEEVDRLLESLRDLAAR